MRRQQRRRLDQALVGRGLACSPEHAVELMQANRVLVDGAIADNAGRMVASSQALEVKAPPPQFVSRAGEKLAVGLNEFGIDPAGYRCVDVGSSTGGFTDCLLQRGAAEVWAVDVGTHQLHERIRADERVVVKEQTDIRSLGCASVGDRFDLVVVDVSFVSVGAVFEALVGLAKPDAPIVVLVKPQFEVSRKEASQGKGVITDAGLWERVLNEVVAVAAESGRNLAGLVVSPITGAKGNVEFVTCWVHKPSSLDTVGDSCLSSSGRQQTAELIHQVVTEAEARVS